MQNKHTTVLCATVAASIFVASIFAISFVQQQALAQGGTTNVSSSAAGVNNMTGSASGGNMTAGGTMSNPAGTNMTK